MHNKVYKIRDKSAMCEMDIFYTQNKKLVKLINN